MAKIGHEIAHLAILVEKSGKEGGGKGVSAPKTMTTVDGRRREALLRTIYWGGEEGGRRNGKNKKDFENKSFFSLSPLLQAKNTIGGYRGASGVS